MATDTYDITAKYYDEGYATKEGLQDLPFYLEIARDWGGPTAPIRGGAQGEGR